MNFGIFLSFFCLSVLFYIYVKNFFYLNRIFRFIMGGLLCYLCLFLCMFSCVYVKKTSQFDQVQNTVVDDVSPYTCIYYLADEYGLDMNRIVAEKGILWSLHGVYNFEHNGTAREIPYQDFLVDMHGELSLGHLTHFIDTSPKTEYTCCTGQWHDYLRNAAPKGISYDEWKRAFLNCINIFNPWKYYVRRCQFDAEKDCNRIEEIASKPVETYNCKKGKKQCNRSKFSLLEQSYTYWDQFTFYESSKIETLEYPPADDCRPHKGFILSMSPDVQSIKYRYQKQIRRQIETEDTVTTITPEVRRHTTAEETTTMTPLPTTPEAVTESREGGERVVKRSTCVCVPPKTNVVYEDFDDNDLFNTIDIRGRIEMEKIMSLSLDYDIYCMFSGIYKQLVPPQDRIITMIKADEQLKVKIEWLAKKNADALLKKREREKKEKNM